MNYPPLNTIDQLYSCGENCTIHRHRVSHSLFHMLFATITKLEQEVGERAQEEFWQDILRKIKEHRFALCAAPLPVNYTADSLASSLQFSLKRCAYLYPRLVPSLQEVTGTLSTLSTQQDNPLLDAILSLVKGAPGARVALLLKETRFRAPVEDVMGIVPVLRQIELVNQYQLRDATSYDQLLVTGLRRWYPDYIFRAPRAKEIHLFRYGWMLDKWEPQPFFICPFDYKHQPSQNGRYGSDHVTGGRDALQEDEVVDATDVFPQVEWNRISTTILRQAPGEHDQEEVQARLCLLAGGHAVLLDVSEQAKVLVIDTLGGDSEEEEDESRQVKRVSMTSLQPGLFLLLRTSGGGDYLVPVADRILADQAPRMRSMQEEWKSYLRESVAAKGLFEVSLQLIDYGSNKANETNVRNWMSSKNIRPHDYSDFLSIMRLAGLEDKAEHYWKAAHLIDTAHRQAGFQIRKMLLAHVARSDLKELHRTGRMDFELSGADGGSLTAFRIEQISPETVTTPLSRTGRVYSIGGIEWLA
jgi:hypothetical protein